MNRQQIHIGQVFMLDGLDVQYCWQKFHLSKKEQGIIILTYIWISHRHFSYPNT